MSKTVQVAHILSVFGQVQDLRNIKTTEQLTIGLSIQLCNYSSIYPNSILPFNFGNGCRMLMVGKLLNLRLFPDHSGNLVVMSLALR